MNVYFSTFVIYMEVVILWISNLLCLAIECTNQLPELLLTSLLSPLTNFLLRATTISPTTQSSTRRVNPILTVERILWAA